MKERPILFSGAMVRALLDGCKTQTRRIVKPHFVDFKGQEFFVTDRCPYGQPGDRLWVRETWRVGAWRGPFHDRSAHRWIAVDYQADGSARLEWLPCGSDDRLERQSIEDARRAGLTETDGTYSWQAGKSPCRWRPSIHMPRWASRISLEVTGVRVERLQDISIGDCIAEGIPAGGPENPDDIEKREYQSLWEQINGPGSWDTNPWVWAVEFRRIEQIRKAASSGIN